MATINTDTALSFAAIGLWHKALAHYGTQIDGADLLTLHPDPNAWGPFNETHDIGGPLDQLTAQGYIEPINDGQSYVLHFAIDNDDKGCWECLGHVRPGMYCAGCGLMSNEGSGDDGAGAREYPD